MRKLASIRKISEIQPIEGADAIELAVVDGWKCVIKKGDFSVGDKVIYFEIDSFLPVRDEFEFLRKTSFKKMGDEEGFRLRTIKLRGQISQGLLQPVSILNRNPDLGEDVTEELGVQKYEAPIPACLSGEVVGPFPSNIRKTDEERIQNLADDYESYKGKEFYVSEKIDGTSCTFFYQNDEFGVCGRNWQYKPSDKSSYWQMAETLDMANKMNLLNREIAVQGELIGPGIQGNRYKQKQLAFYAFNVYDISQGAYLSKEEMADVCRILKLQTVPFIGNLQVPQTIGEILDMAESKSVLCDQAEREGLVWVSGSGRDRISFKTISNKFLAKEK